MKRLSLLFSIIMSKEEYNTEERLGIQGLFTGAMAKVAIPQ